MIAPTLNQIEELIGHLSYQEQLWLLERLPNGCDAPRLLRRQWLSINRCCSIEMREE